MPVGRGSAWTQGALPRAQAWGAGRTNGVFQVHRAQRALKQQAALQRGVVAVPDAHLVVGAHRRHRMVARQLPALRGDTPGFENAGNEVLSSSAHPLIPLV